MAKKLVAKVKEEQSMADLLLGLKVEQLETNIDSVVSHPLNPRRGNVAEVKGSIKDNGYYPTIFVQKSTNYVIKGNHTHKALQELNKERKYSGKFQKVLMNWVDVDDDHAFRILLRDNRAGDQSTYDTELLYKGLKAQDESSRLSLFGTGFDENVFPELERQLNISVHRDIAKEKRDSIMTEEEQRAALTRDDVPDALFASDNEYGIPTLEMSMMADYVDSPIYAWGGQRGRKGKSNVGTYHFYTTDGHIEPLWKNPAQVVNTVAKCLTEINFSVLPQTPIAMAIYHTYRKRWLARYFQSHGIKIFVDLTVSLGFEHINMLGVPKGWKAYSQRGSTMLIDDGSLDFRHQLATEHAGTDKILMLMIGGGRAIQDYCKKKDYVWIPDEMAVARGAADDALEIVGRTELE